MEVVHHVAVVDQVQDLEVVQDVHVQEAEAPAVEAEVDQEIEAVQTAQGVREVVLLHPSIREEVAVAPDRVVVVVAVEVQALPCQDHVLVQGRNLIPDQDLAVQNHEDQKVEAEAAQHLQQNQRNVRFLAIQKMKTALKRRKFVQKSLTPIMRKK